MGSKFGLVLGPREIAGKSNLKTLSFKLQRPTSKTHEISHMLAPEMVHWVENVQ